MKQNEFFKYLNRKYYNPEDALGFVGKTRIFQETARTKIPCKLRRVWLDEWVKEQRTSTLHTPIRKRFPRKRIISEGIDYLWELDLMDMSGYAKHNDGVKYVLCVIDTFSKRADVAFQTDKQPSSTAAAFERILDSGETWGRKSLVPAYSRSDKGKEFEGKAFQNVLKKRGVIKHYYALNPQIKSSIVERFQRTIKTVLFRYFSHHNTFRFIEVLPKLVRAYNNRKHRSIKMAPNQVSLQNQEQVRSNLYGGDDRKKTLAPTVLSVGDTVRISKHKSIFDKGYLPNFTEEIFTIKKIKKDDYIDNNNIPLYSLEDSQNEPIQGTFYREELVPAAVPKVYLIERVLQRRVNPKTKQREALVRWFGHRKTFDSWLPETELSNVSAFNE